MAFAVLIALLAGCKKDNPGPDSSAPSWEVSVAWPRGTFPVPSPDAAHVLFLQEENPAGFYLLSPQGATQLNASGPDVQPDYAWSTDGRKFAFSAADQSGGAHSGVFTANLTSPTVFTQLWDHGNHPRFLSDVAGIVCAGPEDGSELQGIWQIDLTSHARSRIAPVGTQPEVSPDGLKISYLIRGTIFGRLLVVIDRTNGSVDTLTGATSVMQYSWLGTSDAIVFEKDTATVPSIMISYLGRTTPPEFIVNGIYPAGFLSGRDFVYTGMLGDRNDGIFRIAPGATPERISDRGTLARPVDDSWIFAQDSSGILQILRAGAE